MNILNVLVRLRDDIKTWVTNNINILNNKIDNKLDSGALPGAIDDAIAQAKESGDFKGEKGEDGISVTHSWNGTTLTITSASGTSSADLKGEKGETPQKGTDYFTAEDVSAIASEAASKVDLSNYQIKTDDSLATTDKTIVGAINEVNNVGNYLIGERTEGLAYTLSTDRTYYICSGMGTSTAKEIVIAPVYNGLPVKEVGASAFRTNAGKLLTKVTIPEGVTKIGTNAFRDCAAITAVSLPNTLTAIEGYAFQKCTELTNLIIPDSVTFIGQSAFNGCTGLVTLTIGKGVKQVALYAFQGCEALTHIYFNATAMNDLNADGSNNYIFKLAGAAALSTELVIGNNVTRIPKHLMHSSSKVAENPFITSVKFEEGSICTIIDEHAFCGCAHLTKIEIPESVAEIGTNVFNGCTGLAEVYFNAVAVADLAPDNYVFYAAGTAAENGIAVVIGKNVTYIPANLFHSRSTDQPEVNNPPNVTSLAFESNSACTRIGASAFSGCTNLKTIELPANLKTVGDSAFNGCTYLSTIYFNAIAMDDFAEGNYVFVNAGHLDGHEVDVKIGQDVTRIPTHIFHPNADTELAAMNRPPNIAHVRFEENSLCETIGEHTFSNCPTLKDINIPHGVKTIGKNAFASCTELKRITIPDSVTEIVDYAFYNCTKLEYIEIPDSVLTIGRSALRDCHKLKHVRLPNKLTILAKSMFEKTSDRYADVNESIESVIIPKSVTTIELEVFLNAVSLRDIYYTGTEEEWHNIAIDSTVDEPNNDIDYLPLATIHYNFADNILDVNKKLAAGEEYIATTAAIILSETQAAIDKVSEDLTEQIAEISAPSYSTGLAYVDTQDGVAVAGIGTCQDTHIRIPPFTNLGVKVVEIADYAFSKPQVEGTPDVFIDNETITSIEIPDTVTKIGNFAFTSCTQLTNVKLSHRLKSVGTGAFAGCTALQQLIIPSSVQYMGLGVITGTIGNGFRVYIEPNEFIDGWNKGWCKGLNDTINNYANPESVSKHYVDQSVEEKLTKSNGAITEVETESDILDNTTKLYRYIDAEGNPSHIIEVVGSTGARSAGSEYTPIFEGSVNTSEQLTPETLYGCFDHSLSGSLTISDASQAYRLQYKDPDGNILTSGIRLGSSKNAGAIIITPIQECTIRLIKYYTYIANTNTISGYDTNAAVNVNGDVHLFVDDTTPLEINLKAGVEYTISTNPEGYSGRVILTSFSFGSASMHHHELARMDDVDAVKTALLGTSSDRLGAKTTIYAATSGAIENKANIATNTSAIASLKSSVGNVQIWDAQTLPTAAAKYLNTLYKYQNTIHQCVTIGDGKQLIFPLAITGTSEIVPAHYAADGSIYTELGKDFKEHFTIDSVTKGFRNGDSIKLGSSSNTGSIVLTSIAEEEITRIQVGVRAYNDSKSAFRIASGDLDHTWPIASKTEETLLSLYSDESASLGSTFTIETVDSITTVDKEGKETVTTCDKRGIITRIIVDFGNVSYEWKPINGGGIADDPMLGTWVWNFDSEVTPVAELDAEFNFISYDDDGIEHDFSHIHIDCLINQEGTECDAYNISYYDAEGNQFLVCDYESGREESWHNDLSRTIIVNEQPSAELAAFIKTNATKQKETLHTRHQTVISAINELHTQLGDIDAALDAILSQTHAIIGGEQ